MSNSTTIPGQARLANPLRRTRWLLALWSVFCLMTGALMLALLWLPLNQLHSKSTLAYSGFFALLAAALLAFALRPRGWNKARRRWENSVTLKRDSAAPLYQMVEKLGQQLGLVAPLQISLIDTGAVFIHARRSWNGRINSLHAGIGLPLLASLSEAELGALIAHEYGHFFAGKLPLGPWVYRTRLWLVNAVADLDDSLFPPDRLFHRFACWFLRLSHGVAREQEFAADMLAAHVYGVIATRAAIEKIHLISPMWSAYLEHELNPAIRRGARLPVYDGYRRFCKPGTKRAAVQAAIHYAANRPPAEFDCLPSLAERVSALTPGARPAYPPLADCLHLLGGESAIEHLWYAQYKHENKQEKLLSLSWDEVGSQLWQAHITQAYASGWMNPEKLALSELPGMVRQSEDLWDKIRPAEVSYLSPQGKRNYVLSALEEWTAACLIQRGFSVRINPGQAMSMERGAQVVQPAELITAALAGTLKSASLKQFDRPAEGV